MKQEPNYENFNMPSPSTSVDADEPPFKKSRSKVLNSQARNMVYQVNKYFLDEKANRGPLIDPSKATERTSRATNVCIKTVQRICSELNKLRNTQEEFQEPEFFSPKERNNSRPVTNIDDVDKCVLRKLVLGFYERREIPTLDKIKEELEESMSFNGSVESLRKVLLRIGFKFSKVDGHKFLMERSDVTAARSRFLREMRQISQSHQNFVYVGDTFVNQFDSCSSTSQARKGNRLIILHAGTKDGFINKGSLVFSCQNYYDYHKQISAKVFEGWFKKQLLPNIEKNSVLIMDNAEYHCKLLETLPTMSWQKSEIRDWLVQKGDQPSDNLLKAELFECVKKISSSDKTYAINKLASKAGHKVIRLPIYHTQYNPMETIWTQVKAYVVERNTTFKMAELKVLVNEALSSITSQNWTDAVKHVDLEMKEDSKKDIVVEKYFESFINNVTESSDSDDEQSE